MQRIQVLLPGVAEKIAAGEVIERPSSVVKELVENSLDAGATEIQVSLVDGGKGLIEITDNGIGMGAIDLGLCAQRHATSKIRVLGDLERLSTLGFRGEALPSVAAVSDLRILSRAQDHAQAYEWTGAQAGQPGAVTFGHFLGGAHGTRIQVHGLFSQVPVRLKFLKSSGTEVSQVRDWMERLALSNPAVGFRLLSEDRTLLQLRPQDQASRARTLLAGEQDFPVIFEEREVDLAKKIRVRAYWVQGLSLPQTRKLAQVVNGRSVKDRMLQQAMLAPFKQALLPGQFPAVAVFLDIDPGELDVNVHPTKTEVRFLDSRRVFSAVSLTLEAMLGRVGAPAHVPEWSGSQREPWSVADSSAGVTSPMRGSEWSASPQGFDWGGLGRRPAYSQGEGASQALAGGTNAGVATAGLESPSESAYGANQPLISQAFLEPSQFIGSVFNTYLIYDLGSELALIDQHAAHERVRYEMLKRRALAMGVTQKHQQVLLVPEVVAFEVEKRKDVEDRLAWLESLGFELEIFGENQVLFRAIPVEWGTENLAARLKGLVERVIEAEIPSQVSGMDEALFEKLASEACKSSVRAGDRLVREKALALVEQLFKCEHPWNCPHGRPTCVRIPKARFEEWFFRRV